ncbi:MAG TPA: cation-translocating P-type ATPase [Cytophagaceae bacterium]|nr:cation-translocating P-type ATPase [Cytophagaceae bacterium]
MENELLNFTGLTTEQVEASRKKFGGNTFKKEQGKNFFLLLKDIVTEPMFLLLIVACIVYFLVSQYIEGIIMLVAMALVASISFFQEGRSRQALEAVRRMSQPRVKVIREGKELEILSEELVTGDIFLIEEGEQIPADGLLLKSHDFSIDESVLTGESLAVSKNENSEDNKVYLGSTVKTGNAYVQVTLVGVHTMLGKLGKSVEEIKPSVSRFQKEIRFFIRMMAVAGAIAFFIVLGINYNHTHNILTSLLFALALAMSILPEEIPVAFSTFMALGSLRLLKEEVLAKDPQVVETLGAATVICIDKTGTITENRMKVAELFSYHDKSSSTPDKCSSDGLKVLTYAMWASEPSPFDPMEIAIHKAYEEGSPSDERKKFNFIHEYPLAGTPPVMTHVYENKEGKRIVACKGGSESVIHFSNLSPENSELVQGKARELASKGYRVLGVASADLSGNNFPNDQKDFTWIFLGLIGLYDPPKKNIREVLQSFYNAGIKVKIISGDFPETTRSIANEIGFKGTEKIITGNEIMNMSEPVVRNIVNEKFIFARMFPDAKLRVVNALKANGEIVAMTGDGVNDGPALKAADIGVSMGSAGTEIAKQASSIVLLSNDLAKMFFAIITGRKIYVNLKKAIRYILSIHISIITAVLIPLLFGWDIVNIFSPVHIIFFEIVMGPTCSIIYENEPMEADIKKSKPRQPGFLHLNELVISIIQGLMISLGVLGLYYFSMSAGYPKALVRSMVFSSIVIANIILTLENRSFKDSILKTIRYKNNYILFIISITVILLLIILYVPAVRNLFLLDFLRLDQLLLCAFTGFVCVAWIEIYKLFK